MIQRRAAILAGGLGLGIALAGVPGCTPAPAPGGSGAFDPARPPAGVTVEAPLGRDRIVDSGTVYVPIYSSVASADSGRPVNLAATLTIRNLDAEHRVEVASVRYHDASGRLVRDYLPRPVQLAPLAALNLFVREGDNTGGPAPSFLVEWQSGDHIIPPFIEAVMISTAGSQGIAFTSIGRTIAGRGR